MRIYRVKVGVIFSLFILIGMALVFYTPAQESEEGYEARLERGKKIYEIHCLICHGSEGDGRGPLNTIRRVEMSGRVLEIFPRDLAMGVFRFRTTPTGCLPTDNDLMTIISEGIPRSFMAPFKDKLTRDEITTVIEYIKTFSSRWEYEEPCEPVAINKPQWVGNEKSVKKGEKVYKDMKCGECHGYKGKGDGPKSNDLRDDWGKPILPFNFATGDLKRGSTPENIYITFTTGLDGTGMPSYEDSLNEEDRWHLVSYTLKLMGMTE